MMILDIYYSVITQCLYAKHVFHINAARFVFNNEFLSRMLLGKLEFSVSRALYI